MDPVILNNRYELLSKMGVGGTAYVYKARDKVLNRIVAVKTLKDEFAQDKDFIKRFKDEALSVAKLSHENIVNVYDVGYDNSLNYIVMECIEGTTLSSYMETTGPLEIKEVIEISVQICAALEHAHSNGIIHRDIKPQNILISKNGKIKVTDFGIAKAINTQTLTTDNKAFGSVHYISPEQAKGVFLNNCTDIYSTGIVMYEMTTGKVPFDADTPIAVVMKHVQEEPVPPRDLRKDMPEELNRIILKAIAKKPNDRYAVAGDMARDLKNIFNPVKSKSELSLDFINGDVIKGEADSMNEPALTESDLFLEPDDDQDMHKTMSIKEATGGFREHGSMNFDNEYNVPLVYAHGRRKKEKKYVLTSIIAILCVLALSTAFVVFAIDELAEVVVPETPEYEIKNYVGYDYEEIKKKLENDFDIEVLMKEAYSDENEPGTIMDQDVEEGRIFKEGGENIITFTVSVGSNYVQIPICVGLDNRIVEQNLIALGFDDDNQIVKVEEHNNDYEAGYVYAVSPSEGVKIKYNDVITIYVSLGSQYELTTTPRILGLTKEQATALLTTSNLIMNIMSEEPAIGGNVPTVTYQYPEAGQPIYEQSKVDVRLSYEEVDTTVYEDIYITYAFEPTFDEVNKMTFPVKLIFKLEYSDKDSSFQEQVTLQSIDDIPYTRTIRIPAKGQTKLTVFLGANRYKPAVTYIYEDYWVAPQPTEDPDVPADEPPQIE
ncbi:MAG: Stk1 family PASTA domain-containing Ser/Thr kinase [Clostridia bacterium]